MRHLTTAILGIALLAALAGCGKKGDLDLPPGAKEKAPTEESAITVPDEDVPIDLRPTEEGMGVSTSTRGNSY